MGVKKDAVVTADPALSMEGIGSAEARELLRLENIPDDKKILGISIRSWKGCTPEFWENFANGVDDICEKYDLVPVWIPLMYPNDIEISKTVQAKMKTQGYILKKTYSAEEIVGIAGECELTIAMRLHSLIYAAAKGVPAIGVSYDPKVSGFVDYIGTSSAVEIKDFTKDKLLAQAQNIMENREVIKKNLSEKIVEFRKKAQTTAKQAIELIER